MNNAIDLAFLTAKGLALKETLVTIQNWRID